MTQLFLISPMLNVMNFNAILVVDRRLRNGRHYYNHHYYLKLL